MSSGEVLSLLINIAVGGYFAFGYPHLVARRFAGRRIPPLFARLPQVLRPVGLALIGISLGYGVGRLAGWW